VDERSSCSNRVGLSLNGKSMTVKPFINNCDRHAKVERTTTRETPDSASASPMSSGSVSSLSSPLMCFYTFALDILEHSELNCALTLFC